MAKRILFPLISILLFASISCKRTTIEEGVSLKLASKRQSLISDVAYNLHFDIPKDRAQQINGRATISFELFNRSEVVLDFRTTEQMIKGLSIDGTDIDFKFANGHIIIPKRHTAAGKNTITIEFISGDGSLNRSSDFLYTLLVPDRASTVFPCFDQPDIKATFTLSLNLPARWTALSNGKIDSIRYINNAEKRMTFQATKPISTYLFAFAVGNFRVETKSVKGRTFSLYHRETDSKKLKRNIDIIFELHAQSLNWLEEYTGIPHPFGKLDFILIPGFQYSGMEHPGAIYYRDSRLLLDENPSINQKLRRANLIAHEVAHQWFGNLVTMRWFSDVWLKEVFAGFMADLMINPQYPELNHELRFLLSHFPRAYSVDRTIGANPIVQQLDNMLDAGTLYGDIIYHKAPVMMQQLELLMGAEAFRLGVQEYLQEFYMANADWSELVAILDNHTEIDLKGWSKIWTQQAGRPIVKYSLQPDKKSITIKALGSSPFPPMWVDLTDGKDYNQRIWVDKLPLTIDLEEEISKNNALVMNSSGLGYGCFVPDSISLSWILENPMGLSNSLSRASTNISLFEMFLEDLLDRNLYTNFIIESLNNEQESQIQNYLLNVLETVFWRFTPQTQREDIAFKAESALWELIQGDLPIDQRKTVFSTLTSIFTTNESFSKLYTAWTDEKVFDLKLNENERTKLAFELIIRKPDLYHAIALGELERIDNPDRIAQFDFILKAVSPNPSQRVAFFESLQNPNNRKPEPWVIDAIRLLHHPLRSDFSIRFIEPSLDMIEEIQQTGDIFFPKNWLDATLSGHSSPEAIEIVEDWMEAHPKLSPNLKMKLLQSSDLLFRAKNNLTHTNKPIK